MFQKCRWAISGAYLLGCLCAQASESFIERFETLDAGRWYLSHGWSNGDHQACTWSNKNVRVENSQLILTLRPEKSEKHNFTCSEVQSKATFGFGMYEIRARAAAGSGLVTGFFTYSGPPQPNPHDEIDFEWLGRDLNAVQTNYFVNGQSIGGAMNPIDTDGSKAMHNYAFQWLPDSLRWYIDGKLVREVLRAVGEPYPTHSSKILVSLWNSDTMVDWLGPLEDPAQQATAAFEWIAFTAAGEKCKFRESILCGQTQ